MVEEANATLKEEKKKRGESEKVVHDLKLQYEVLQNQQLTDGLRRSSNVSGTSKGMSYL